MPKRKSELDRLIDFLARYLSKKGWDRYQIPTLLTTLLYIPLGYILYILPDQIPFWIVSGLMTANAVGCIIYSIVKKRRHPKINTYKELLALKSGIRKIDAMNPYKFEEYVGYLFEADGFKEKITSKSVDKGADVIAEKEARRICVQVKHYTVKVPFKAIQEVVTAMLLYRCNEACIVTNSFFTRQAKKTAEEMSVDLIDRDRLIQWINEIKSRMNTT
jgi:HJR/Mrr/RecB family endonuclease